MESQPSWTLGFPEFPAFHEFPDLIDSAIRGFTDLATSRFSLTRHLLASLMIASPSLGQMRLACQDGGASRGSRLPLTLKVERELVCGLKTTCIQHITAILSLSPSKCLDTRIRFC
jgi:hypothetical protein